MDRPHRVLLVDDDPLVRSGLRLMLAPVEDVEVVGEAADGDEAVTAVHAHAPDVVLMDLRMPGTDGIVATERIRSLPRPPEVVALTTWDVDDAVLRSIRAGAAGFLLKTSSPDEILRAIRAVMAGDAVLSPHSTRQVIDRLAGSVDLERRREAAGKAATLTERERAVVVAVARGASNADVARELYVSEATVKTHLSAAQAKLGARNRVEVAVVAERAGLLP